jgi:Ca2+-binding EF-hand superfamily protein
VTGENLFFILSYAFGDFISKGEMEDMIREADTDKNNTIELGEFI